jgi:hypothetical protein
MTFILVANHPVHQREVYWCGGLTWSLQPQEAALFMTHEDAASTVPILTAFNELDPWPGTARPERWPLNEQPA